MARCIGVSNVVHRRRTDRKSTFVQEEENRSLFKTFLGSCQGSIDMDGFQQRHGEGKLEMQGLRHA
jgi:hypothetical protein